ncbi:hypothetical protein CYY_000177 [Polysphondylium violaceum]|nr:hypothetical protein CYY_000177 [Polysphondylium violaceum]
MIKDKLDYGNIKDHELIRQVYVHPSSNEKKGWAKVMLNNSNLAKQIQKIINGEVCNGEILKCTGSGISLPSTLSSIFGTLVITLINLDGGKGKLEFERALSPSELAQVQLLPIFKDFQSNGKFTLSSISYDEDNIREYIFNEKLPQPKKIILYRRPISQEFGYNDVLDMDKIIPQSSDIDSGIPFKDLRSNTYGIKYYFNDATLLESIFQNLMRLKDPKYKINVYYNSNVSIHFQINKLNCDSIDTLSKEFKSLHYGNRFKSVTNSATTSNGNNSFEYKLSSKNINQLKNTINSFHLLCNPSDIFTHSNKELVFSTYGRKCMAKLSIQTYLYWNNKTHTIMIYSNSKQEIEDAKNQLNSLVTELENLQIDTKFTLTLKGRLELVEQDKKDSNFIIKLVDGLKDSRISGRTLFVTGTKESIDKLEMIIKDKLVPRNRNNLGTKECSICFSEDEELFTFQKCGHQFCRSCINSDMLVSNNSIQKCASIGCDAEISLCDILNICSNGEDLDIIKRRSILEYQRKNSSNVYCCPNPLCLQLLKLPTKDILLNSGDINNSFVFCDQCKLEYCIFCSKKQGKATLSHRGLACSVSASAYTNLLDLLNTKCPNCQMVFFEFDGCYAVVCTGQGQGGCQAHFCGFCLHISSDSISNHNHVQNCAQNPGVGYYADKKVFYDIRNNEKKKKIIESIKKEQDMEKRLVLFNSIKSHCEFNIYEYEIK